ncbi:MAG: MerR family transcriptional regulator [Actinomycetota bacterium]|nr:MAG: MerR family transcriptional regulator [Actinomycetota bacterium]
MSQFDPEHEADSDPQGPFKIEDLASIAKISIDTIRFYQTRGLLEPPSRTGRQALYERSHLSRLNEIRELQRSGLSLNTIRRIFSKDVEAADRALFEALTKPIRAAHSSDYLTLDELALRTSIPKPLLQSLVNEGLIPPVKVNELEVFPSSDIEMARAGLALLESGIPLSELLELAKRHHDATRKNALLAIELFDEYVRNPITQENDSPESGQKLIEAFNRLLPAAVALVAGHFERTLLALAQSHLEQVGAQHEKEAVRNVINSPSRIEPGKPSD